MTSNSSLSFVWDERFWFPVKLGYGWKDMVNEPGSDIYKPDLNHLHWSVLVGVLLLGVRYVLETLFVVPIAVRLGLKNNKKTVATPNIQLEASYKKSKNANHDVIKSLAKQTDLSERQIEIWFRNRKKQDKPTPIQKFRECSWHLIFYTTFFVYGIVILWEKPYFWKTSLCWDGWPFQHVGNDVYYYYMMELGFYWSLVFSLFSDHKRKDFKEMIIHHIATIVLMYFSWIMNFVRVGTLVLAVHDSADTWLSLAKMSIYAKIKTATDIFFGIFLVIWVISRLVIYPFVLLRCTTIEPFTIGLIDTSFGSHLFFNFFLYILQVLHLIWTYAIFKIAFQKLNNGEVEDTRSDSEEDSGEESDNEDDEMQKKPIANGDDVRQTDHIKGVTKNVAQKSKSDIFVNGNSNAINGNMKVSDMNGNGVHIAGDANHATKETDSEQIDSSATLSNGRPVSPSKIPRARKP